MPTSKRSGRVAAFDGLRYRAQALAAIDAIENYLNAQSLAGAQAVFRAIYASTQLIAEHPQSYPRTDDSQIRVDIVQRYRYRTFYAVVGDSVKIIHNCHGARRVWSAL